MYLYFIRSFLKWGFAKLDKYLHSQLSSILICSTFKLLTVSDTDIHTYTYGSYTLTVGDTFKLLTVSDTAINTYTYGSYTLTVGEQVDAKYT